MSWAKDNGFDEYDVEEYHDDFEYPHQIEVTRTTPKAILVQSDLYDEEFWVPRSQLRGPCVEWETGDFGTLWIARSWAEKEGWID